MEVRKNPVGDPGHSFLKTHQIYVRTAVTDYQEAQPEQIKGREKKNDECPECVLISAVQCVGNLFPGLPLSY